MTFRHCCRGAGGGSIEALMSALYPRTSRRLGGRGLARRYPVALDLKRRRSTMFSTRSTARSLNESDRRAVWFQQSGEALAQFFEFRKIVVDDVRIVGI